LCGADDQQLLQWAKDDRQAFAEFLPAACARRVLVSADHSASESDAADLTQQVFLRALRLSRAIRSALWRFVPGSCVSPVTPRSTLIVAGGTELLAAP
jgi:hypothetical protein